MDYATHTRTITGKAATVGSVSTGGSAITTWPSYWPQNSWVYPTVSYVREPVEDYANEVEVTRGEHDSVVKFYRRRDRSRTLVKEITIPNGVLDWLASAE